MDFVEVKRHSVILYIISNVNAQWLSVTVTPHFCVTVCDKDTVPLLPTCQPQYFHPSLIIDLPTINIKTQ